MLFSNKQIDLQTFEDTHLLSTHKFRYAFPITINPQSNRNNQYYLFHHSFVPSRTVYQYSGNLHFYQTIDRLSRQTMIVVFYSLFPSYSLESFTAYCFL